MAANSKAAARPNNKPIIIGGVIIIAVIIIAAVLAIVLTLDTGGDKQLEQARLYAEEGDFDKAVKAYWAAIDEDPKNVDNYLELGRLYEDRNENSKACSVYHIGYRKTDNETLNESYKKLLLLRDDGSTAKKASSGEVSVNSTLAEKFASFTFFDYQQAYGSPSISGFSKDSCVVTYKNIKASFLYKNTEADGDVLDAANKKPRDAKRPYEITLDEAAMLFVGMDDKIDYVQLHSLSLDRLEKTTDPDFGSSIVTFFINNAQYKIECAEDGGISSSAKVRIYPSQFYLVENIEVPDLEGLVDSINLKYPLRGWVCDDNGTPITGAKVTLKRKTGMATVASTETDYDGDYYFTDIPSGRYIITVECSGFKTINRYFEAGDNSPTESDGSYHMEFVMEESGAPDPITFVLEWNAAPADLDAHLIGVSGDNTEVHIYSENLSESDSQGEIASLDRDDLDGYGPETITLTASKGSYLFVVADPNETGTMSINGATVKIYVGNELYAELSVPTDVENVWEVCGVDDGNIQIFNWSGD